MEITDTKLQEALAQIVNDIVEGGVGYVQYARRAPLGMPVTKAALKHLCQYGVIGVSTVVHNPWSSTGSKPEGLFAQDHFMVWLTVEGHAYLQGQIEVEKECTLEATYWSPYRGICKRHGRRHTEDEFPEKAKR